MFIAMPTPRSVGFSVLAALCAVALAACAGSAGFQQASLREQLTAKPPEVNDEDVARALALKPQLPKPFRLGIFFRKARSEDREPGWRWSAQHKRDLLESVADLRTRGEISDAFIIDEAVASDDELPAIRVAAARHGADAVLVVSGIDASRSWVNAWAVTYAAIVPIFLAPGTDIDTIFMTNAELWDVRNEYLYLAAQAESEAHQQRPGAWIDHDEAAQDAQKGAVQLLGAELKRRFALLGQGG
jgi:hypothetical protein